jgi:hypothetical protein
MPYRLAKTVGMLRMMVATARIFITSLRLLEISEAKASIIWLRMSPEILVISVAWAFSTSTSSKSSSSSG